MRNVQLAGLGGQGQERLQNHMLQGSLCWDQMRAELGHGDRAP